MEYIIRGFERLKNVEVFTVGAFTGDWIPWSGGLRLPQKYVRVPDVPLPPEYTRVPYALVAPHIPFEPDLFLQVDAGFHFIDKPKATVVAHVQTDPHCAAGDTLLATDNGILYPEEAMLAHNLCVADKEQMVLCDKVIRQSELQQTMRIILETGQDLSCTDDHLVETVNGFVLAKDLRVGDRIVLSCGTYAPKLGTDQEYSIGFILGAFQGDGSFGKEGFVKFTLGTKKEDVATAIYSHMLNGFGVDTVTRTKHYTCENAFVLQVRRWGFYRFLKSLDIKSGNIPLYIRKGSRKLLAGYIAGLLSTDGCSVNGAIQITMKSDKLARELQTVLFYLGVPTTKHRVITNSSSYKPGQKYNTIFVLSGEGTDKLHELTGDIPGKFIKENSYCVKARPGSIQIFSITSIEGKIKNYPDKRSIEPVYDVVNSQSRTFLANGISVHNCLKDWYKHPASYSDVEFCMQQVYMKPGEFYLPYAYDEKLFYPMPEVEKIYDACLIGLHYPQRDALVARLRSRGLNIYYSIGEVYDEYRLKYNQSKIALNWSSLQDLNARTFEALGLSTTLVTNRVPDLPNFFVDGEHYLGFDNLDEAEAQVMKLINDDELRKDIAAAGHRKVKSHTWKHRANQILEVCKLI
jgi:hypothetical protein